MNEKVNEAPWRFPEARILDINLTEHTVKNWSLSSEIYRLYPGGSALATYLLLKEIEPGVEPLSPGNMLIFTVSPLTGLPINGTSRVCVACKSPLTGACGDSQAGGSFPVHLKANGLDAVILRGKSEKPVYVYINGDNIEIKDAKNVWGKVTRDAEEVIKSEIGDDKLEIAQIGPAGENLVRFACILNDSTRANGRNGVGAVMGSKNLKALVVHKGKTLTPVDTVSFKKITDMEKFKAFEGGFGKYGTAIAVNSNLRAGFLPTKNFQEGIIEGGKNISGTTFAKSEILKGRDSCFGCSVRCKRVVEIPGKVDPKYGGPEYETIGAFGSSCGNVDMETVCIANQLCNMYGMDTISAGMTIAFAMECFENEIIGLEDTGGLDLSWTNYEVIPILLEKIAKRESGIGDILAEGSKKASDKFGLNADKISMTVKSQEIPMHDPRMKPGLGVGYSVNPFGPDHNIADHDNDQILNDDKIKNMFESQKFVSLMDILCLCQFCFGPSWQLYKPNDVMSVCKFGIGWDVSLEELYKIGERKINMMRVFNAREGFTRKEDVLPERFYQPIPEGPSKGVSINKEQFKAAQEFYYEIAGWDKESGNPTNETLKKLDLDWLI